MPSFPEFKVERLTVTGSLADRVTDALIQLTKGEDFPPGSRLPSEMSMASRFGVSRTVIREAISRLKSDGLVESRQGSGVFVREGNMNTPFRIDPSIMDSIHSIQQVIELRKALEGEITALAAERRSKAQLAAIKQALKQIDTEVRDGSVGTVADITFHRRIAEATGNPHFLSLIEFLFNFIQSAMQTARGYESTRPDLAQEVKDEHLVIVDAIAKQDVEAARAAARHHMDGSSRRLDSIDPQNLSRNNSGLIFKPASPK